MTSFFLICFPVIVMDLWELISLACRHVYLQWAGVSRRWFGMMSVVSFPLHVNNTLIHLWWPDSSVEEACWFFELFRTQVVKSIKLKFWSKCIWAVYPFLSTHSRFVFLMIGGGPKTVTQMLVTLSVDHRVYDGDTGGAFLHLRLMCFL